MSAASGRKRSDEQAERTPVDQLVDLFVYAPVGLMLEYQDLLPKLIKRGRSQVQLTKLFGTMAAKQGQRTVASRLDDVVGSATDTVAQGITEFGTMVGLAPEREARPPSSTNQPLPIAGYDDLTAREIIGLLPDLSPTQREQIRIHESAGRGRKTVLAKLDALADDR